MLKRVAAVDQHVLVVRQRQLCQQRGKRIWLVERLTA